MSQTFLRPPEATVSESLKKLIEMSRNVSLSPTQKEEQRRSFAYGNANIENGRVTKETVAKEAEALKAKPIKK
jgi:hypothetical protein